MISTGTLGIIVVVPLPALKVDNSIHCVVRLSRANSLAKFKRASSSARRATRDTTVSTFIIGGRLGITVHCICFCFSGFKSDWLLFTVTGST